jgi:hypothetical protein
LIEGETSVETSPAEGGRRAETGETQSGDSLITALSKIGSKIVEDNKLEGPRCEVGSSDNPREESGKTGDDKIGAKLTNDKAGNSETGIVDEKIDELESSPTNDEADRAKTRQIRNKSREIR